MKRPICINEFVSKLESKFSYNSAVALLDYIEKLECDSGTKVGFDVIVAALRRDYTEYSNL